MDSALAFTAKNKTSIVAQFDKNLLSTLLDEAKLVELVVDEHLFHFGQPATHFFWIKSGDVALYRPCYGGEEKIFRTMGAGDTVAETMMFINDAQYPLAAQALGDVIVYKIPKQSLLSLCQCTPALAMQLLESMAIAVSQSLNRIDLLTIGNAAQRLASYLLDLYIEQRSAWFSLPVRQAVLARQLNITPETFSRQLTQFRRAGFIGGRNPEIVLLDIDGLCRSVNLPVPQLDLKKPRERSASLGDGLFECCSYFKETLNKSQAGCSLW